MAYNQNEVLSGMHDSLAHLQGIVVSDTEVTLLGFIIPYAALKLARKRVVLANSHYVQTGSSVGWVEERNPAHGVDLLGIAPLIPAYRRLGSSH